jgi:hypothetical protein
MIAYATQSIRIKGLSFFPIHLLDSLFNYSYRRLDEILRRIGPSLTPKSKWRRPIDSRQSKEDIKTIDRELNECFESFIVGGFNLPG